MNTPVFVLYLTLVVLGALPALTFPIYYSVTVRWWQWPHGSERETAGHAVMFSTLFALLYVRGGINLSSTAGRYAILHQSSGGAAFLMFIAALAAFLAWQRLRLFHRGRKARGRSATHQEAN